MQLRRARNICLAALTACFVCTLLLVQGCGDANAPQATVEEIVRAVRAGRAQSVERLFLNTDSLHFFEEALPDASAPAVGTVNSTSEDSATVDVLINAMRPDAGGFTFVMRKSGDSWRVAQVLIKEG
jgi:hypothetical protein